MALSNIFREPRREIIETVAGLLWTGSAITLGSQLPLWLGVKDTADKIVGAVVFSILIGISPFILLFLAVCVHTLGEIACDTLAALGLDPRPRQRY